MLNLNTGVVYFRRGQKHPIMVLDEYEYRIERKTDTRKTWCCRTKEKAKCKARIVSLAGVLQFRVRIHSHPPTFDGNYSQCTSEVVRIEQGTARQRIPGHENQNAQKLCVSTFSS